MKTKKAVKTHNAIVDAAKVLFMKKSVNKVTVSEIIKKAGVAKGTFYIYFESKEDLVWHFIEHQFVAVLKWIEKIEDVGYSVDDIEQMIDFIIQFIKDNIDMLKMIHSVKFYSFLGKQTIKNKYFNDLINPLYLWLEKGIQLGELQVEDPHFLAIYLSTSIHEMIDLIIEEQLPYSFETLGMHFKSLLIKLIK